MTRTPPMTSFIGREESLRQTRAMLGEARLVTVTGPGGIGKTRLAHELVRRTQKAFADGVAVVELATLEHGREVAPAVASALAVPDQSTRTAAEQIVRHLAGRRTLLLVDNCEHVLEATAHLLAELLDAVEELSVITTSREPLGIAGEQIHALGPMDVPRLDQPDARRPIDEAETVRLMVDRARALVPGFEVDDDNREAIVQLCERLDGMPLAIELATARFRSLSVQQVLTRLDERFTLLTGGHRGDIPHHRTLWALVEWSHDLCTPTEQRLWSRLSVFPGTFDLDAVEAVCVDEDMPSADILDVLDRLVAKSIVTAEPAGVTMRYRLLVTIREFGAQQLGESARTTMKQRHRDHYLDRAATMVRDWCGPHQSSALADMRGDHPNLIAALEWSAATPGQARQGARLASLLRYHWIAGGRLSDGRRWLERLLDTEEGVSPERGDALWVAAWVCLIQGDRARAETLLAECREVARSLDDEVLAAHADHWTGLRQTFSGRTAEAVTSYRSAVAVFERHGLDASTGTALFQLGMAQTYEGEHAAALETCARVLAHSEQHGERWCRAYALWVTSVCQWHLGDPAAASRAGTAALELQRAFRDGICIALTIDLLSWLAHDGGDDERSAELAGAAGSVWAQIGTTIEAFGPRIHAESKQVTEAVNRRLGSSAVHRLRSATCAMTRLEAVELALGTSSAQTTASEPSPLTRRESEVAALIADGLTNKAIAERLVISPRTVDGHVERIFGKLDVTSRSQIAARVAVSASPEPSDPTVPGI